MTPPPVAPQEGISPKKGLSTGAIVAIAIALFCSGGAVVFAIGAAVLFPVFSQARKAGESTRALSEGKQVGIAILIYTADSDDAFPPSRTWLRKIEPYLKVKDRTAKFALNARLGGTDSIDLEAEQRTALIFSSGTDGAAGDFTLLPSPPAFARGNIFVRADGSAKIAMTPDAASVTLTGK